jgi:hypothetical protein
MAQRRRAFVLLLALLLADSQTIWGQQTKPYSSDTWSAVKSLSTGSDIVVKLKDGKTRKGNYVEATDESLALSIGKSVSRLNRNEIQKLHLVVERNRDTEKIIAAASGAAAGVAISFSGDDSDNPTALGVFLVGVIFAGIGYGLAHWFTPKYKKVLIYETNN